MHELMIAKFRERGFLRDAELLILITHRLANVRHADRIFVLHDGALREAGTYAELFSLQAAGYQATADGARDER